METKQYISVLQVYEAEEMLPQPQKDLLQHAKKLLQNAYAPYSNFRVACAVLLNNGIVIGGTNQENIAFPSGLCAERVALFAAGTQYPQNSPVMIAITAQSERGVLSEPPASCGGCLQVIAETEMRFEQPITIILAGQEGNIHVAQGVKTFMPWLFKTNLL